MLKRKTVLEQGARTQTQVQ